MASDFLSIAIVQLWQVTALIVLVAIVNRRLAGRLPHLAHVLWLIVLVKCLTPPLWSSASGVFCWLQPEQCVEPAGSVGVESQAVTWKELLIVDTTSGESPIDSENQVAAIALTDDEAEALLALEPAEAPGLLSSWSVALRYVWLSTVATVLLVVVVRWWRFWRRVNAAPRRECADLDDLLAKLSGRLGVKRVRLVVTECRIGPAVIGVFRKTILLPAIVVDRLTSNPVGRTKRSAVPATLAENCSDCQNCASLGSAYIKVHPLLPVLAHELLHVRRGDLWVGLLQTMAQAVWWFHPLVWWVGRVTSREAERCCDEEVLAELKCDPAMYARSLLDVFELKSQLASVPVFPGVKPVDVTAKRLERIMTLGQGCRRRTPLWCWLIAVGVAAITLPGAAFVVTAQDTTKPKELPEDLVSESVPARQHDGQAEAEHLHVSDGKPRVCGSTS